MGWDGIMNASVRNGRKMGVLSIKETQNKERKHEIFNGEYM